MGQSRNPCKWTVSVPGWTTVWRSDDTGQKGGPVCWCRFDKRVHEKAGKEADSSVVHFHDCAPLKIFSFKSSMGAYFCFFSHSLTRKSSQSWTTATLEIQVRLSHGLHGEFPHPRCECSWHLKWRVQQGTAGWNTRQTKRENAFLQILFKKNKTHF